MSDSPTLCGWPHIRGTTPYTDGLERALDLSSPTFDLSRGYIARASTPLRHLVVFLQRGQTRSPAHSLRKSTRHFRHWRDFGASFEDRSDGDSCAWRRIMNAPLRKGTEGWPQPALGLRVGVSSFVRRFRTAQHRRIPFLRMRGDDPSRRRRATG